MTESRVYVIAAVALAAVAAVCASDKQWLGALGSAFGASQAMAARFFLIKWRPLAAHA